MDIRKMSSFIIAVGIILMALGGGSYAMVENKAKQSNEFRQAMRDAEINSINRLSGSEKLRAEKRMLRKISSELGMMSRGYTRRARKNHTISYGLMIGGVLVMIVGIGMRVSSPKKEDMENMV